MNGRFRLGLDLVVALAAAIALAGAIDVLARRPEVRLRADATKTRAYSLSPQTRTLLAELEGDWCVALVLVASETEEPVRRQATEVLRRFRDAAPTLEIVTIDPTRPETIPAYEALLARLRGLEAGRIAETEAALDAAAEAFDALRLFAQRESAGLESALARIPREDDRATEMRRAASLLGLLAREGERVLEAVAEARRVRDDQPLPDWESARSALAQALGQWSDELAAIAATFRGWSGATDLDPVVQAFAARAAPGYATLADRLAAAAAPLLVLEPLEIARIGRELQSGELAIVIGPERAAVIPSAQLFPSLPGDAGDGGIAFDRRFRGEQVIASAIRSLQRPVMPMVVWVHASPRSLLASSETHADLVAAAGLAETARFTSREWIVGRNDRPASRPGQRAVWVVIPPTERAGLEPDQRELALIAAAERLIEEGEPVLLGLYPSLLPRYRREDPWARLAARLGVVADTNRVAYRATRLGADEWAFEPNQAIDRTTGAHPLARAADGQRLFLVLPVPLDISGAAPEGTRREVIAAIEPQPSVWIESRWETSVRRGTAEERGTPPEEPVPAVVAIERRRPGGGVQRCLVVGSGGWMLTRIADAATPLGGGRAVLMNPGNPALLLGALAWLAGEDDLIARSPVGGEVARLERIEGGTATAWALLATLGLPGLCLVGGTAVWWTRRS